MHFLSIDLRVRLWQITLATFVVFFTWFVQSDLLTKFSVSGVLCNLPLTVTILWGSVFSSRNKNLSAEEIRALSLGEIALYQAFSGSLSGAYVGALFAALFSSSLPIYPLSYPLIGWMAGYFSLKHMSQPAFLSIPLVLFASIFAESLTAVQLAALAFNAGPDRAEAISRVYQIVARFSQIALPESILNALIAPIIVVPMRTWYDSWTAHEVSVSE